MNHAKMPKRPPRVRDSGALRMSGEQAQRLTKIKSARAARLSRETAAAKRRLITTGVSLAVVLLFIGLAAFSILPWWPSILPGAFLIGTLVASRQAGIRTEKAHLREEQFLKQLNAEIRGTAVSQTKKQPERFDGKRRHRPNANLKAAKELFTTEAESATEVDSQLVKDSSDARNVVNPPRVWVAQPGQTPPVETAEETIAEETTAEEPNVERLADSNQAHAVALEEKTERTWSVADFPAPNYSRKPTVTGRQVHADTDLKGVPRIGNVPARPVATSAQTETIDSETAAQSPVTFDLDAILDARRAQ